MPLLSPVRRSASRPAFAVLTGQEVNLSQAQARALVEID
jgi:hypothetical protein